MVRFLAARGNLGEPRWRQGDGGGGAKLGKGTPENPSRGDRCCQRTQGHPKGPPKGTKDVQKNAKATIDGNVLKHPTYPWEGPLDMIYRPEEPTVNQGSQPRS